MVVTLLREIEFSPNQNDDVSGEGINDNTVLKLRQLFNIALQISLLFSIESLDDIFQLRPSPTS